jgi:hypothetical protein
LVGQKSPLKLKEIWAIRVRLELSHRKRELALFILAIDSKLRLRSCAIARPRCRSWRRTSHRHATGRRGIGTIESHVIPRVVGQVELGDREARIGTEARFSRASEYVNAFMHSAERR